MGSGMRIIGIDLPFRMIATGVLSLVALYPVTSYLVGMDTPLAATGAAFTGMDLFYCGIVGLAVTTLPSANTICAGCIMPAGCISTHRSTRASVCRC